MTDQALEVRAEPTAKRVRATAGGGLVFDSVDVLLVWEHERYPQFYVPEADIIAGLEPGGRCEPDQGFGVANQFDVVTVAGTRLVGAAWAYDEPDELVGRIRFEWDAMDAWFEEDETVHVHPRSPYVRIDALRSSREIRVVVDQLSVAHSTRSVLLFETGLPPRVYIPPTDVRLDVLRESGTVTRCPYKGTANYFHIVTDRGVKDDLVWFYEAPLLESASIAGLLAFPQESCAVFVDGVRQGAEGP